MPHKICETEKRANYIKGSILYRYVKKFYANYEKDHISEEQHQPHVGIVNGQHSPCPKRTGYHEAQGISIYTYEIPNLIYKVAQHRYPKENP